MKTSIPENSTKNDVFETQEKNLDILKMLTSLVEELKKLDWSDVLTVSEKNQDVEEKEIKNNTTTEVHGAYSTILALVPGEPNKSKEATQCPIKEDWIPAIKSEIENFHKCEVWKKFPREN